MSDFTTINMLYNTGTDASPVWTGTAIAFGGSSGANEIRWCASGAGGAATGSASWPYYTRPASVTAVNECWAFTADTTGSKIGTYDGTNGKSNVVRWNWDAVGTMVSSPSFSAYANSSHVAPSAGTQPPGTNNDAITNGHNTDTSNTSYLKANAYGQVIATTGTNIAAGAAGTTPTATSGTAGSVSPTAGTNWLSTWQSLQGGAVAGTGGQYITAPFTPAATTANTWPWTFVLYTGPNMTTGTWTPVVTLVYSYS